MACFMLDLGEATLIVLPTHINYIYNQRDVLSPGLGRAAMDTGGRVAWGLAASARQTRIRERGQATQRTCCCLNGCDVRDRVANVRRL